MPGSSYHNLNKILVKYFVKIEGANIETNSLDAREILDSTNLEPNENLPDFFTDIISDLPDIIPDLPDIIPDLSKLT